jgi:hypothetical protein
MFENDVSEAMAPYASLYQEFITSVAVHKHSPGASDQIIWEFPNGYGASLSSQSGRMELAVRRVDDQGRWRLCYSTSVTSDVVGIYDREDCGDLLTKILALETVRCDFENER